MNTLPTESFRAVTPASIAPLIAAMIASETSDLVESEVNLITVAVVSMMLALLSNSKNTVFDPEVNAKRSPSIIPPAPPPASGTFSCKPCGSCNRYPLSYSNVTSPPLASRIVNMPPSSI